MLKQFFSLFLVISPTYSFYIPVFLLLLCFPVLLLPPPLSSCCFWSLVTLLPTATKCTPGINKNQMDCCSLQKIRSCWLTTVYSATTTGGSQKVYFLTLEILYLVYFNSVKGLVCFFSISSFGIADPGSVERNL
jgi:hypothetical protein